MGPDAVIQLVCLVVLILLSGLFSSAETALTTVSLNKLRAVQDEGGRRGKKAAKVLAMRKNSPKLLSAVLIGNNIVNLSASALGTVFCTRLFGNGYVGLGTGVLTFLILIFGEITPKSLASLYNLQLALFFSRPVSALMWFFTPLIWILNHISLGIFKLLKIDPHKDPNQMTETELRKVVDVSREEGIIEPEENKMINNVVDFGDAVARDIMVPRADVICADVKTSYRDLMTLISEENYSRIPIFEESKDHIIGILHVKDLLMARERKAEDDIHIRDLMRKPVFVFEYQRTAQIFKDMKTSSATMCIVLDEYGITAGVITMEDLVEEIVGDIRDEYDNSESELIQKMQNGHYSVDGAVKLDDLNDAIGTNLSSDNYDSIGGLVIEKLDRLPVEGDHVTAGKMAIDVTRTGHNRVERVELYPVPKKKGKESVEELHEKND